MSLTRCLDSALPVSAGAGGPTFVGWGLGVGLGFGAGFCASMASAVSRADW